MCSGSIPACAGEPVAVRVSCLQVSVYPRVCGGTGDWRRPRRLGNGLSPRVRGNRVDMVTSTRGKGSIPACAGEPLSLCLWGRVPAVYPRVCGGTQYRLPSCASLCGLSPRVRGNPAGATSCAFAMRSIPACAGEPRVREYSARVDSVYPRVCGGTPCARPDSLNLAGLSPRVRGNLLLLRRRQRAEGSIPACAGEPLDSPPSNPAARVYPRVCGGTSYRPAVGQ